MNGTLPTWIERLLGVEAGPGEGAAWSLRHEWPWPPWVSLVLVAVVVLLVVAVYLRENRRVGPVLRVTLISIRLAVIGIVLLMIARFTLCVQKTGLPYLAVIVDDSASMSVVDRYADKTAKKLSKRLEKAGLDSESLSRENLAKLLLVEKKNAWLRRFADGHKLRFYFVSEPREIETDGVDQLAESIRRHASDGPTSPLGTAVERVLDDLRGTTPAGIVLLTDGINTVGPGLEQASARARQQGVPLLLVGLGDDRPSVDLKLSDLLVDEVVFVDDVVYFEATLTATGCAGEPLRVTLREEGKDKILAETRLAADGEGRPQSVRLPYRPEQVGAFRFTVEVEPLDGELQTDNNRLTREVEVRKQQIRVLLVQAYPNFEYRYLRKMLDRDSTIRLDTLLQEADLEHARQDASALAVFPVRRDELFAYDVILLGDVDFKRLGQSALENLAAFVDDPASSGSLVFIAGPKYNPTALRDTPLARLLPVALGSVQVPRADEARSEPFVVEPTELGLASPAMQLGSTPEQTESVWKELPPLYWMIDAPELKPGVRVLAVNPNRMGQLGKPLPVICMQYVGPGKVWMHMTDETWRWRLGSGDRYFARYWVQTIRYLSRSKLLADHRPALLSTPQREYRQGETVDFRLRFADPRQAPAASEKVVLIVEKPGQPNRRVTLSRHPVHDWFEGELPDASRGKYHAWLASPTLEGQPPTVDFEVVPPAGEFKRIEMDAKAMQQAAEKTRGRFYTIADAGRLPGDLPSGLQVPIETLPPVSLWNAWPLLLLFFVLLITEWVVRKRKGMV